MTTQQIIDIVLSIFPSALSILTAVGIVFKVVKQFADLKKQVVDMKDLTILKNQMQEVLKENYELKATLNETMTKIDHIERK